MRNRIIKFILVVWVLVAYYYLQKLFVDLKIKNDILNSLITFFSILFWFYITSLSIFVTSKYVSELYNIDDKDNPSQTLLHKLLFNYKIGLILILFTILYLLLLTVLLNQWSSDFLIIWEQKILFIFIGLILWNIWYSYKMLWTTFQIIVQESKSNIK